MKNTICLTVLFLSGLPGLGDGSNARDIAVKVKPGELVVDHPTLINLGFEWVIEGDDNRNARVEVSYRKHGDALWKQGLPLLRLHGERIYQTDGVFDVISPNMFAGSILDLDPEQHRLSRARRINEADQRRRRRTFLQQHDPD